MDGHYHAALAIAVFLITYVFIVSERFHRTVVALLGAVVLLLTGLITWDNAIHAIDFNTIGLLIGMMIIVGITKNTGVFEYMAIKAAKMAGGEPLRILASISLVTAILSALLDNVTTVLLIVPVTFAITNKLKINPLPFLFAEILASNIGGTATLVGDPPNIMIGSATKLGFMDFVLTLAPVVVVIYILSIFWLHFLYRSQLSTKKEMQSNIMQLNERDHIKDPQLMRKSLVVLVLTILGFVLHQYVHLESSIIALSGASLLLLITGEDVEHALQTVEWPVIFFFTGLFVVVGGLEEAGVIESVANRALETTGGNLLLTGLLILWLSAMASAFVDNIPFVAAMIPLIQDMGRLGGITELNLLWWSLSLGACLGGNGTIIGASANIIVVGLAEKRGHYISFMNYFKLAFPMMLMSIIISTGYLMFWHLYGHLLAAGFTLGLGVVLAVLSKPLKNLLIRSEGKESKY
ncbi:MAG: Arsenical pump membrane protein [Pelotomaculum sp. PtaU1.Bin035]|nr:MAG: Arsenical pump membrane protein [Pelotomaculum sp. PtaU1.Bin035]